MGMNLRFFAPVILAGILFFGCNRDVQISQVDRENLFNLQIGRLEDQIALFSFEGEGGVRRADVAMRDGLFYISDGNGAKVLRYNSYGDLLFMIYNEETNPPPMSLKPLVEGSLVTRWAVSYPLLEPGEIAVDSRKHIYVRDRLPYERHSYDTESRVLLNNIILHFDADGKFIHSLGREGVGGSPFPKIEGIYTSVRDELAVVCRILNGWDVYWFNPEGIFLFLFHIKAEFLPIPVDRENMIPSLDMIAVGPDERTLFIKIDYYRDIIDESTNTRTGIESDSSVIWIMNAEDGIWDKYIDVPFFEYTSMEQNRKVTSRVFYSLLGVMRNGRIFLYSPVEEGYSILIMSSESGLSGEQRRSFIRVDNDELHFNAFDLSEDGILSGLLVDDWQVKLVWWRTDRFLGEPSQ